MPDNQPEVIRESEDDRYHWFHYRMFENLSDAVEPAARVSREVWRRSTPKERDQLRAESIARDVRRNGHLYLTREEAVRNMDLGGERLPAEDPEGMGQ